MRQLSCPGAILLGLFIVSMSQAASPTVSPELLAASSDLVVVGKVKEIGQPKVMDLTAVGAHLGKANVQSAQVVVERPIASGLAPATQPDAPKARERDTIEVVYLQSRARLRLLPNTVQLQKDGKYILYLRKVAGSDVYFLFSPVDLEEASDDAVATAEKAAKTENWPWGPTVRDLRVALLIPAEVQGVAGGAMPVDGVARVNVAPMCAVAIQNLGTNPIAINAMQCLSATITQGTAKSEPIEFGPVVAGNQPAVLIPPGGIVLLNPNGATGRFALPLRAGLGQATIDLAYTSDKIGFADEKKQNVLWKGKLTAKPTEIEITQNLKLPQPPRVAPPMPPQPAE